MEMEREQQTLQAQIKRIVRDEIAQGVWQSGARIPTESELMHRFSVSRITVSQALKDLVQEGLVVRRQGRGTFVSAQQAWVDSAVCSSACQPPRRTPPMPTPGC
jgi:DNA-binding GntR family transcriptional regulator